MNNTTYGLDGRPAGNPGFTVSIEIDTALDLLSDEDRARLTNVVSNEKNVRLEESPLGLARLVFDLPRSGWWKSGQKAVQLVDKVSDVFPVVAIETCRSDVWLSQPFFNHETDGLGDLPEWCTDADDSCTVAIEVEAPNPRNGRPKNSDLLRNFAHTGGARLAKSKRGKRHLIVEQQHPTVKFAAQLVAKSLHSVSGSWSITRIRSVIASNYRLEVTAHAPSVHAPSVLPRWQYASVDESTRVVVISDGREDRTGWGIDWTHHDGIHGSSGFVRATLWRDKAGIVNLRGVGRRVPAWTADIPGAARLDQFRAADGTTLKIDEWDSTTAWLVESLVGQPVGLSVDLGPSDYDPESDDEVINAQLHVLDDGVVMVRRSREVLERLRLADHSSDGLALDVWHDDDMYDDCTDGYLFSRDLRLVATACTVWFRHHGRVDSLDKLGCSYDFVDELPRSPSTS